MKEHGGTITPDRDWQVHVEEDGITHPLNPGYKHGGK
jgi:hypothetical protein